MSDDRRKPSTSPGWSRRGFLTTAGLGTLGFATVASVRKAGAEKTSEIHGAEQGVAVDLEINGRVHALRVQPRVTLLHVLREDIGLTGTKLGCGRGECGACTVLLDGVPRYACLTLALEAEKTAITTVEGLLEGERLGPVQEAFREHDAFQCGYCTSGQIMTVEGLLRDNPEPSLEEIRIACSGNLCRCGAYPHIFQAAARAAELRKGGHR